MGKIYDKAIDAWYKHYFSAISEKEKAAKESGDQNMVSQCMSAFADAIREEYQKKKSLIPRGTIWDFSNERLLPILASGKRIYLRPIAENDIPWFAWLRYSMATFDRDKAIAMPEISTLSKEAIEKSLGTAFLFAAKTEVEDEKSFVAAIVSTSTNQFIGYVSIKDTAVPIWEIAIELFPEFCHKGFGPDAIQLFLVTLHTLTEKNQFRAFVELDNISSQRCMEKAGGKLYGLFDMVFRDPVVAEKFENENTELITPRIIELANELQLEPKKLLSKVLDYRFYI